MSIHGGHVYFVATDGVHGREIWRTDGTSTTRISDIVPGPGTAEPDSLVVVGSRLLFRADFPAAGRELGFHVVGDAVVIGVDIEGRADQVSIGGDVDP